MLRNAAMLLARNDARDAAGSKCYYTVVVEDVAASKIVATATLLVEVLVVPVCMPCRVHVNGVRHYQLCSCLSYALAVSTLVE